jgi:ubiquinone biosynthesis protein COQ4
MHETPRWDLARARRAVVELLKNPDDTRQVFEIVEALPGRAPERNLKRFRRTESGARLLRERPALLARLSDTDALERMPDGSLGRAYLEFLRSENITAKGLVEASQVESDAPDDPELEFFQDRLRDAHDLWHTVTGYKGDLVGEGALLAFSFAQTHHPGVGFIVLAGLLNGVGVNHYHPARRELAVGFWRGFRATWLPAVEWEKLLETPIAEVRERLGVGAPRNYEVVRSSELPESGLLRPSS